MSRRLFVALAWLASSAQGATLARQPYLQDVRDDRATLRWTTTGDAGQGEVRYGPGLSYSNRVSSTVRMLPTAQYQHTAVLAGLVKNTLYSYRVFVDGNDILPLAAASDLQFHTPEDQRFVFLALGDSGDGGQGQLAVAGRLVNEPASFVLHTGDIAYDIGTWQQFDDFYFAVYQPLLMRIPFFLTPGNHDYYFQHAAAYRSLFAAAEDRGLYYSFDWGPAHFTVLDSNEPLQEAANGPSPMLQWLDADLSATAKIWRIVMFHHLPFPNTHHLGDEQCALAEKLITPILERHSVHLVLTGHEHNYQRTQPRRDGQFTTTLPGTVYVTTGGGGAGAYPPADVPYLAKGSGLQHYLRAEIDGPRMLVRAISFDGQLIDEFTLSAAPEILVDGILDSAAFSPSLAPGSLMSIFGKDLATLTATAASTPLPLDLAGVRVTMNASTAPLLFVSRGQINAQVPLDLQGRVTLRIRTPGGTAESGLTLVDTAPAFFLLERDGSRVPSLIHLNSTVVTSINPAAAGEWLVAYMNGLGRLDPSGRTVAAVSAAFGLANAEINYAGAAPGFAGLYQVNLRVPTLPSGTAMLKVSAGGAATPLTPVPIR